MFALTPTSWVAGCLAWTARYAANLRPGQSISYSPQPKQKRLKCRKQANINNPSPFQKLLSLFCNEGRLKRNHLWIVAGKQAIMGGEIVACDVKCLVFVLFCQFCTKTGSLCFVRAFLSYLQRCICAVSVLYLC